jgi:hypothetical protein
MAFSTTEITSHEIVSDNPVHQRLFFAYYEAATITSGNLLEIGVGVGRGLELLTGACDQYTGIDKNGALLGRRGVGDWKRTRSNMVKERVMPAEGKGMKDI